MVVSEQVLKDMTKEGIERHFCQADIDLSVACYAAKEQYASQLRPLRADLVETTFVTRRD